MPVILTTQMIYEGESPVQGLPELNRSSNPIVELSDALPQNQISKG